MWPSGCAEPIRLSSPPGFVNVGFKGGEGHLVRIVSPFIDDRPIESCSRGPESLEGPKRTYSGAYHQLACSSLPPEWIADRFSQGLVAAGFSVIDERAIDRLSESDQRRVFTIEGEVKMVAVESMAKMQSVLAESDIQVVLHISQKSGLRATRSFHVKSQESALGTTTKTLQDVLNKVSDRAVVEMTAAVLSLVNRYPTAPVEAPTAPTSPAIDEILETLDAPSIPEVTAN